jgi:hypothetical protein
LLFGEKFFELFCAIDNENSELKFSKQILELQLNTLKKKNEEFHRRKDERFFRLQQEIEILLREQLAVTLRVRGILNILKEL